ncbi:hypothetical protein Ahy_A05g023240 isoform F [Arachis hypogaea]|uniref:Uncharacterized protein n=1 Tax=Arachis hypogaea TaxID=3818 RepID=A0A445D2Q8_ARAHY|nr:hypothetical protein Ahy_A05g023240 isoform F [Arachis hypogaea]
MLVSPRKSSLSSTTTVLAQAWDKISTKDATAPPWSVPYPFYNSNQENKEQQIFIENHITQSPSSTNKLKLKSPKIEQQKSHVSEMIYKGFGEDSASDSSPLDEINGDEAAKEIVEESTRVAGIWDKSGGTHNGEEVQGLFSMLRVHFLRNFR